METEDLRIFIEESSKSEWKIWVDKLKMEDQKWAVFQYEWKIKRNLTILKMEFPFSYREGQKDLVTYVYQTIYHKKKLFLEAPTGVGKTISTIYPSIKSMEKNRAEKIFYLTANTITRTVAEEAIELLRKEGLKFKSVILTAKEKICFMEHVDCNPDYCPYANGHYDRINDTIYELLLEKDGYLRENIELYAQRQKVLPL